MKVFLPVLVFSFLAVVNAQYFSQGWKPGQKATEDTPDDAKAAPPPPPPKADRISPSTILKMLDIDYLITTKPAQALFASFGVNITEKLSKYQTVPWGEGVQLITDQNWEELIVNEPLTQEEEKDRVWVLIITGSASQDNSNAMSKFADEAFDLAYNETLEANDLPNVRWGRIDYLNVTYITTKWAVWQAPTFVILQDRGRSLRFIRPHRLRLKDGAFLQFLLQKAWTQVPVWDSSFAPGRSNEVVLHYLAKGLAQIYIVTVQIPRWLLFLVSTSLGSFIISMLHGSRTAPAKKASAPPPAALNLAPEHDNTATTGTSTSSTPKKGGAKQRKGKK